VSDRQSGLHETLVKMTTVPVWVSDKEYSQIESRILESYPNACILYVDKVVNDSLYQRYLTRKELIRATEVQMFHGTCGKNILPIITDGFDPKLNIRAAYGPGVYFAKNAIYSANYMHSLKNGEPTYMFLADVLVGKDGVDNHRGPDMLTTVHADGSFPRYVIAFHKEAK